MTLTPRRSGPRRSSPSATTASRSLADAILQVDADTDNGPAYYMINCAHPTHFGHVLEAGGSWLGRLRGIRANASRNSHAELDAAAELDAGDPHELATEYASLMARFPQLTILGGCCGTDDRHIEQIAQMCITSAWPRTDALRTGSRTDALRTGSWTDAVRTVY